jgi:hypothetical protein
MPRKRKNRVGLFGRHTREKTHAGLLKMWAYRVGKTGPEITVVAQTEGEAMAKARRKPEAKDRWLTLVACTPKGKGDTV